MALGPVISPVGDWPLIGDKPHITVGDVGYLTLDAILADAAVTSGTILVPAGTHTLHASNDRTLKTGLVLQVLNGASIAIPAGRTLTFSGKLEAGVYSIFNLADETAVVTFNAGSIYECQAMWFMIDSVPLDPTGATDNEPQINAALESCTIHGTGTGGYDNNFIYQACPTVRLPAGTFLVDHRILVYTGGPALKGFGARTTTLKITEDFPAAATDLGYGVVWIGYPHGKNPALAGMTALVLEDLGINIAINDTWTTVQRCCIWGFSHPRRAKLHRLYLRGSTAGNKQIGIHIPNFVRNIDGSIYEGVEITAETVGTGDGTRGPYTLTYANVSRVINTVTADPSGSPQVITANSAMEWDGDGVGRATYNSYTDEVYFDDVVASSAPIKATYTYSSENYHTNTNSSVWSDIKLDAFRGPYGALLIENSGDAGNMKWQEIDVGGCYIWGTIGCYNGTIFDNVGWEGIGDDYGMPWAVGTSHGGWHPVVRLIRGYNITWGSPNFDSPNITYWFDNATSGSAVSDYELMSIYANPNIDLNRAFIATADKAMACTRTGATTITVPGDCTGSPHQIVAGCFIVIESPSLNTGFIIGDRHTYYVTDATYNGGTQLTTITVNKTTLYSTWYAPPDIPVGAKSFRRISNQVDWFSTFGQGQEAGIGVPHMASRVGRLTSSGFRIGPSQRAGLPWTMNQQYVGQYWWQTINCDITFTPNVAARDGTSKIPTTEIYEIDVPEVIASSKITVAPAADLPDGVWIAWVRTIDYHIRIAITNGTDSAYSPGEVTWKAAGVL